jgi:hypothetical protein
MTLGHWPQLGFIYTRILLNVDKLQDVEINRVYPDVEDIMIAIDGVLIRIDLSAAVDSFNLRHAAGSGIKPAVYRRHPDGCGLQTGVTQEPRTMTYKIQVHYRSIISIKERGLLLSNLSHNIEERTQAVDLEPLNTPQTKTWSRTHSKGEELASLVWTRVVHLEATHSSVPLQAMLRILSTLMAKRFILGSSLAGLAGMPQFCPTATLQSILCASLPNKSPRMAALGHSHSSTSMEEES